MLLLLFLSLFSQRCVVAVALVVLATVVIAVIAVVAVVAAVVVVVVVGSGGGAVCGTCICHNCIYNLIFSNTHQNVRFMRTRVDLFNSCICSLFSVFCSFLRICFQ